MEKWMLWLIVPFCAGFILTGSGLMAVSGRRILEGCRAARWPHTVGTVVELESRDKSDAESRSREIVARYTYMVDGRPYTGSVLHPAYGASSFEAAHRGLEQVLLPGRKIRVYYRADAPSRSCVSVGFFSGNLSGLFGGALFAAFGIGFLLIFWFALAGDWNYAAGITVEE